MRSVIQQSVVLPARAESLFEMYLDAESHAAITGFPAAISAEPAAPFHAFNKQISGQILAVVRPNLIVQSWRSVKFHDGDPDSTLILTFISDPNNAEHGRIDLVHLDVPEHDYQDVIKGWQTHYWNPWRTYLKNQEKGLLG
jgi:activator of HSP90 ATPase